MIIKIITVPNPILRQKSKTVNLPAGRQEIDKKTKELINDLIDTVKSVQEPKGVGLSAVQIGKLVRIFIIKQNDKFTPFINPKIIWQAKKIIKNEFLEGCLSVPSFYGLVARPQSIKLAWQNLAGKWHQKKFVDKESVYLQHELDHLNGVLFVDQILAQKGKLYRLEKDETGNEIFREVEIMA